MQETFFRAGFPAGLQTRPVHRQLNLWTKERQMDQFQYENPI